MRKLAEGNRLILIIYGCLLVCLASYFVFRDVQLAHELHHKLPLVFLIRFSLFWLVSLLIAVTLFLVQLSYHHLVLKEPDKVLARRAGYLAIGMGMAGTAGMGLVLYLFQRYPAYFYF